MPSRRRRSGPAPGPRDENGQLIHPPLPQVGRPRLARRTRNDPNPIVLPMTDEQRAEAASFVENFESRLLLLAHIALGHIVHNPTSSRSIAVRRAALHDLMLAKGDIGDGGVKVQVNSQVGEDGATVSTLVVLANHAYPHALPEGRETVEAEVIEAERLTSGDGTVPDPTQG